MPIQLNNKIVLRIFCTTKVFKVKSNNHENTYKTKWKLTTTTETRSSLASSRSSFMKNICLPVQVPVSKSKDKATVGPVIFFACNREQ